MAGRGPTSGPPGVYTISADFLQNVSARCEDERAKNGLCTNSTVQIERRVSLCIIFQQITHTVPGPAPGGWVRVCVRSPECCKGSGDLDVLWQEFGSGGFMPPVWWRRLLKSADIGQKWGVCAVRVLGGEKGCGFLKLLFHRPAGGAGLIGEVLFQLQKGERYRAAGRAQAGMSISLASVCRRGRLG